MNLFPLADRFAASAGRSGVLLTIATTVAVVLERALYAIVLIRRRTIERRYAPVAVRALAGDDTAAAQLAASPRSYRMVLARMLINPLYTSHDGQRVARTREIVRGMGLGSVA